MHRRTVPAKGPYAPLVGYSRAVRVGDVIAVSGTAPIFDDGSCPDDTYEQARQCLAIIVAALAQLGAGPEHVVRTRMFVTDAAYWEDVGRAHGEVFAHVPHPPATAMVVVRALLDERWRVEIEADARVSAE